MLLMSEMSIVGDSKQLKPQVAPLANNDHL